MNRIITLSLIAIVTISCTRQEKKENYNSKAVEMNNKAVKKTLTVPQWLDTLAQRQKINFSQVLQKEEKI